jgi:large subunit ribosomal protein L25
MEEVVLSAKRREVIGKQVKALRRAGLLPAVLYGHSLEPITVTLDLREASRILPTISSSHLVVIDVDGERHTALVREKQRHPVQGSLRHVDFMVVSMTEKLRATVMIELHGDAPVVKNYSGVLVTGTDSLQVECLPGDLPERVVVDLKILEKIGDVIHVRDIILPAAVEVLTSGDEMVVLATAPVSDEALAAELGSSEPEVIEKGKKEAEDF